MVKTEERLDSDVISNIQWECEKIEIIGREMAFKSAWHDCQVQCRHEADTIRLSS